MNGFTFEKYQVWVEGYAPIMFDPFIKQETDTRPGEQKFYFNEKQEIILPNENIHAFFFGEFPAGCAKTYEGKQGKKYIQAGQSYVAISPMKIPILVNGKPTKFTQFDDEIFSLTNFSPRAKSGSLSIKQNAKPRPVINKWAINFEIALMVNPLITGEKLKNWLGAGGMQIALGTYRPRYGRFVVSSFKQID